MLFIKRFDVYLLLVIVTVLSCKKTPTPAPVPLPPGGGGTVDSIIVPGVDPATANTIGFFLDDWQPKKFTAPAFTEATKPASAINTVTVDATSIITKIPLSEFGHNAVWWMGPVAGDARFIEPITNLHPHIIRFPGGSSSDVYFWNAEQGANPADAPLMIMDENGVKKAPGYNYGKTNYNWQCNLDNYYTMLQQTNNKGIITVNYGYARYGTSNNPVAAAAHLAADWVRYDKGRTQYWEIGNENFGSWEWGYRIDQSLNKDGQPEYITGALYAQHFNVFVDSMQKAAAEIGSKIQIGTVTYDSPATESWQTNTVKTWNTGVITGINNKADFYVVHNYFTPFNQNSNASVIFNSALTVPETMMKYITQTIQTIGAIVKTHCIGCTLVNTSAASINVEVKMKNFYSGNRYYWYSLKGSNDNGEFSRKVLVNGNGPTGEAGGPISYHTIKALSSVTTNGLKVTIPARGAVFMTVDKK